MKITVPAKPATPAKKEIFNPLEALAAAGQLASTSALTNLVEGECPKCNNKMVTATAGSEDVYYCTSCRVTEPLPLK